MPDGPSDGPPPDRLVRARCLVPLLGHAAVRLASLSPGLRLLREAAQRGGNSSQPGTSQWADESDPREVEAPPFQPERHGEVASGPVHEARVAADEVLTRAEAVSRFAAELSELCGAEGQWLAILALAPRVVRKFADDFSQLVAALDDFAQHLSAVDASQVAMQPSATAQPGADWEAAAILPEKGGGGAFAEPGRVAVLKAIITSVSTDLKADLEGDPLGNVALGQELEVAPELHRRLLPNAAGIDTKTSKGNTDGRGSEKALLERLAPLD